MFKGKCKQVLENKYAIQQAQRVISSLQPSDILELAEKANTKKEYVTKRICDKL